jgi:hypothetical protein
VVFEDCEELVSVAVVCVTLLVSVAVVFVVVGATPIWIMVKERPRDETVQMSPMTGLAVENTVCSVESLLSHVTTVRPVTLYLPMPVIEWSKIPSEKNVHVAVIPSSALSRVNVLPTTSTPPLPSSLRVVKVVVLTPVVLMAVLLVYVSLMVVKVVLLVYVLVRLTVDSVVVYPVVLLVSVVVDIASSLRVVKVVLLVALCVKRLVVLPRVKLGTASLMSVMVKARLSDGRVTMSPTAGVSLENTEY